MTNKVLPLPLARSRPHMPGYGIPTGENTMLPWQEVEARMESAGNFWVSTVDSEGRPHAVPVWGAWIDQVFYFEGGGRKVRNLKANPHIVVHLESGDEVVIIEGIAQELRRLDRALFDRIDASFAARYSYRPGENLADADAVPYPDGGLFAVQPRVVFAWTQFPDNVTRWTAVE
jgi:hypothetical protein